MDIIMRVVSKQVTDKGDLAARISTSSSSSTIAASSFRLVTRSVSAVPSAEDVRFRPPVSLDHQPRGFVSFVLSFMLAAVIPVPS